jgi:hypothetical protein
MSWQEDLQQLDTALAGGQISADDYRRRRDEVLAKASGGAPAQGGQVPPAQPSTPPPGFAQPSTPPPGFAQPGTPPPGFAQPQQPSTPPPGTPQPQPSQGYFPPPFRWQTTPPQQSPQQSPQQPSQPTNPAEETQTIAPVQQPTGQDADRTQVVPGSATNAERTQAIQARPGDRTQVVQPGYGGQNTGGYNAQYYTEGPGWQGGGDSTPWGGAEFPPLGPAGNWGVKQGPEVFETGGGGKGKRVIAIVAAVVVLALIGGGIWFFTSGNKNNDNQAGGGGHPTTVTTTTKPKPTPAHPDEPLLQQVPPVIGTQHARSAELSVSQALHRPIIDQSMATILTQAGVQQMVWRDGSKTADQYGPTPDYFSVTVIPVSTPDAADALAQQIRRYQEQNGLTFVPPPVPGVPSTITVEKHTAPQMTIYRGLWVCGSDVIWLNVQQAPTTNEQALTKSFQREVVSLTQSFPAE